MPILTGVLVSSALLTFWFLLGPVLVGTRSVAQDPISATTVAVVPSPFIKNLSDAGIDVTGEESLTLATAHRVCQSSEAAATSPESVATTAAVLHLTSDEATDFVTFTRLNCGDLP